MSIFLLLYAVYLVKASLLKLVLPSQDPFYSPPVGFEEAKPGTTLQSRPTPQKIVNLFFTFEVANSWQIMYRSTGSFGSATAIVMTVMQPHNAAP